MPAERPFTEHQYIEPVVGIAGYDGLRVVRDEIVSTRRCGATWGWIRVGGDVECLGDGGRVEIRFRAVRLRDHTAERAVLSNQRCKWETLRKGDDVAHIPAVQDFRQDAPRLHVREVIQHAQA